MGLVENWAATKPDLTSELQGEMAAILQEPKTLAEPNKLTRLEMSYREAKRRAGLRARRDPGRKLEDAVDTAAAKIYGRRR